MNHTYYQSVNSVMKEVDAFQQNHLQHISSVASFANYERHHKAAMRPLEAEAIDAPPAFDDVISVPPPAYNNKVRGSDANDLGRHQQYVDVMVANTKMTTPKSTRDSTLPPVLLELCVGHKLAAKIVQKRLQRRAARLDKVHSAWAALGLDTRKIANDPNGRLPPQFWNPPLYDAEEMNRRLRQIMP